MNKNRRKQKHKEIGMNSFFPGLLYGSADELQQLRHYLDSVYIFLNEQAIQFRENMNRIVCSQGFDSEQADAYYEAYSSEYNTLQFIFPNILRYSVLKTACSLFESSLTQASKYLEKDSKIQTPYVWETCEDVGIFKAASFVRKNFEIYPEKHPKWNRILDYFVIRHCIVHANGNIALMKMEKQPKIRDAINRLSPIGISKNDFDNILLKNEFLANVINDMIQVWDSLQYAFQDNAVVGPTYWP